MMTTDVKAATNLFIGLYSDFEPLKGSYDRTPEVDRDAIMQNIYFAEQLFPGSCIMLCPRTHLTFHYVSKNCESVLGHPRANVVSMNVAGIMSRIHPDDLQSVMQCFEFINNCDRLEPESHRFVLHFRFQNAEGRYLHIRNEHVVIRTINNHYLFLLLFNDLSDIEKFHRVKLDIYKNIKGNFVKIYDYNPRQGRSEMTPRQHTIARLITKGFSNQEIADQLCVSIFTIKNHKKQLFKKVNVRNSIELLSMGQQVA